MAQEVPVLDYTFKAAADLSALQYCFVQITAANTVNVTTAATTGAIGVLQNKPNINQAAEVRIWGISKVVASAAIAAGATIGPEGASTARAVTVTNPTTTNTVAGTALTAAGAAGDVFTAVIDCAFANATRN